jgi:hypothetical protein
MILGYYVVIVLTGVLILFNSANGALLFIIVSSYHFGEQQWQNLNQTFPNGCWYYFSFLYGFVVLLLCVSYRTSSTYYLKIANLTVPLPYFFGLLQISAGLFISLCGMPIGKLKK